jgi:ribosomal protein L24
MDVKYLNKGDYVFVIKEDSPYRGQEGKVLSIYNELNPDKIHIKLELDDGSIIGGFSETEIRS